MTVSILLPTFNQGRFLPRALAALDAQTYRDFELIACDDGSTDETWWILSQAKVRTVSHETNRGTAAAINSAAALATGSILTWVSSDNTMRPEWLATLVHRLEHRSEHGAVYSSYCRHEAGRENDEHPGPYAPGRLISSENCYLGPSFLIRREVWQEHRGGSAHDFDNWLRVEEACWEHGMDIGYVNRVLCDYYAGPWCTARARPELFDAPRWQMEARERRANELAR